MVLAWDHPWILEDSGQIRLSLIEGCAGAATATYIMNLGLRLVLFNYSGCWSWLQFFGGCYVHWTEQWISEFCLLMSTVYCLLTSVICQSPLKTQRHFTTVTESLQFCYSFTNFYVLQWRHSSALNATCLFWGFLPCHTKCATANDWGRTCSTLWEFLGRLQLAWRRTLSNVGSSRRTFPLTATGLLFGAQKGKG